MRKIQYTIILISLVAISVQAKDKFKFAFFTDIHLNYGDNNCFEGLNQAIALAEKQHAAFILTGGDNLDIDGHEYEDSAAWLYKKYKRIIDSVEIDYHVTMGNHDRYWGGKKNNELHNAGMFEKYIGRSYFHFTQGNWNFIVLNSTRVHKGKYYIDDEQKQWLKETLAKIDKNAPIVVSTHVPFLSVYYPTLKGEYTDTDTFSNFKEIWDMFEHHELKLVLQGHMHLYEEIKIKDVQFITAGAVSARWWGGPYHGTQEGFLMVSVIGDEFSWEYVDYNWEVQ